jgi:cytochrome c553
MSKTQVCFVLISMSLILVLSSGACAADVKAGKVTATRCAVCHGEDGEGNGIPKSKIAGLDVSTFKKHLYDFKNGVRRNYMMERFVKKLSDQDIENLAAFFATK